MHSSDTDMATLGQHLLQDAGGGPDAEVVVYLKAGADPQPADDAQAWANSIQMAMVVGASLRDTHGGEDSQTVALTPTARLVIGRYLRRQRRVGAVRVRAVLNLP